MAGGVQPVPASGPTDYRLVAHVLAAAIEEADTGRVKEAVANVARRLGEVVGRDVRARVPPDAGLEDQLAAMADVLAANGFQPYRAHGQVRLANCPFHALAQDHMVLVCGANLAFLDGLVVGLETSDVEVSLAPERGRCCIVLGGVGTEPPYHGG